MKNDPIQNRYEEVCRAVTTIASRDPSLRLGSTKPPCELILQSKNEGPMILLQVWPHRAVVHARSGSEPGGNSELEDHLSVDLTVGFHWDSVAFEDADDLVHHLYKHMLRRQKSVSAIEPLEE